MSFSKKKREAIYAKYDGHCAYCGRSIDIRDMQVDHFLTLRAWGIEEAGTEVIVRTIRCANAGTVITRFYAQCRGCFAQTGMDARTQKSAIDAWNRRVNDG